MATTSPEASKAVVRRLLDEFFSQGKLDLADELVTPDYVNHDPATPLPGRGPDLIRQVARLYRTSFPDLRFTIEDQVAERDRVVTRWSATATHTAEFNGIPATGKRATVGGTQTDRFVDGKIAETWVNWDALGLLQQLGIIPPPGGH